RMRHPWRSRPRRGFRAAPSWPPFSPQRGGCLEQTLACEGVYFSQRPALPACCEHAQSELKTGKPDENEQMNSNKL
ncbi:hypothetical protein, partial [Pantoea ananatis]